MLESEAEREAAVNRAEGKKSAVILAAAADVVGPSLAREVFSIARERPRRTPAGSSPPAPRTPAADFRCHAPVTLFRRLLARATRGGRELFILSSGAERAIELRSMYDVVNLATFFGMTEKAARAAMTTNVHAMLAMCKRRRDAAATDSVVERMDASA